MDAAGIRAIVAAPPLPRIHTVRSSPDPQPQPEAPVRIRPRESADPTKQRPTPPPPERVATREPARAAFKGSSSLASSGQPEPKAPARPLPPASAVERIVETAPLVRAEKVVRLRVALSPEHLGDLLVELAWRGGALHGTVVAQSDAAKDLIAAHLEDLRAGLERRGIPLGEFRVLVAGEEGEEEPRLRSPRRQLLDFLA